MKILPGETGRGGDSWALLHDHLLPLRLHAAHPHSGRQVHHHLLHDHLFHDHLLHLLHLLHDHMLHLPHLLHDHLLPLCLHLTHPHYHRLVHDHLLPLCLHVTHPHHQVAEGLGKDRGIHCGK